MTNSGSNSRRLRIIDRKKARQARERAGLTQAAAAEALDVSQPQWAQWESGARTPRLDTLARIADILDCELRIEMTPREDSC